MRKRMHLSDNNFPLADGLERTGPTFLAVASIDSGAALQAWQHSRRHHVLLASYTINLDDSIVADFNGMTIFRPCAVFAEDNAANRDLLELAENNGMPATFFIPAKPFSERIRAQLPLIEQARLRVLRGQGQEFVDAMVVSDRFERPHALATLAYLENVTAAVERILSAKKGRRGLAAVAFGSR